MTALEFSSGIRPSSGVSDLVPKMRVHVIATCSRGARHWDAVGGGGSRLREGLRREERALLLAMSSFGPNWSLTITLQRAFVKRHTFTENATTRTLDETDGLSRSKVFSAASSATVQRAHVRKDCSSGFTEPTDRLCVRGVWHVFYV